jgi:hypothetical protein
MLTGLTSTLSDGAALKWARHDSQLARSESASVLARLVAAIHKTPLVAFPRASGAGTSAEVLLLKQARRITNAVPVAQPV